MIGYSVVNTKGQVTIPADIRNVLQVKPGKTVVVTKLGDGVMIKPVADIFSLQGSIKPRSKPENFKAMRKSFIEYLGFRRMGKMQ